MQIFNQVPMSDATLALIAAFIKETQDALKLSTEPRDVTPNDLINVEDNADAKSEEESSSQ